MVARGAGSDAAGRASWRSSSAAATSSAACAGGSVGMDRATADYMGMLATVMNALALADAMRQEGMTARVMSAHRASSRWSSPTCGPKALQYLEEGKVVDLRGRHRQPVLHHRHRRRAARRGDRRARSCSRRPRSTASTPPTRRRTRTPRATRTITLRRGDRQEPAGAWTPRRSRCAATRSCRSRCFRIFKPGALKRVVDGRGRRHAGPRLNCLTRLQRVRSSA